MSVWLKNGVVVGLIGLAAVFPFRMNAVEKKADETGKKVEAVQTEQVEFEKYVIEQRAFNEKITDRSDLQYESLKSLIEVLKEK